MIHVSIGTLDVLGLIKVKADAKPTTAYLMTPGKCFYNCAYCSRANTTYDTEKLSRITWPKWDENEVFNSLTSAYKSGKIKRTCVQVVNNEESFSNTIRYVTKIRKLSQIPVSVSIRTGTLKFIDELFYAGVDRVCLPIDISDDRLFREYRLGILKDTLKIIEIAAKKYPEKISTHIMIGLGETERQVVQLLKKLRDLKVIVGLFAFTPIKGTKLEKRKRLKAQKYRRIQIAHYIISHDIKWNFEYNSEDEIIHLEKAMTKIDKNVFQTIGCPNCNRPFYNERPGGIIYNYPIPISSEKFESELIKINE